MRADGKYSQLMQLYHHEALNSVVGSLRDGIRFVHMRLEKRTDNHSVKLTRRLSELEPVLQEISLVRERVLTSLERTIHDYLGSYTGRSCRSGCMRSERTIAADLAIEFRLLEDRSMMNGHDALLDMSKESSTNELGLYLNLLATFLYMVNYYVVGPTR
jgi:hypothetical protein